MSLRLKIDAALNDCRLQLQANKVLYSKLEYKAIKGAIAGLRMHLIQGYSGYKGKAYPEIRTCLVLDAKKYYGECVGDYLDKVLPALVGGKRRSGDTFVALK